MPFTPAGVHAAAVSGSSLMDVPKAAAPERRDILLHSDPEQRVLEVRLFLGDEGAADGRGQATMPSMRSVLLSLAGFRLPAWANLQVSCVATDMERVRWGNASAAAHRGR